MFWIILSITFIILTIILCIKKKRTTNKDKTPPIHLICFIITMILLVTNIVQGTGGVMEYPCLMKELGQIEALQDRMQDIRDSNYDYEKDGNFVAGSIENYKQSTNLSVFIKELAGKEAAYKGHLRECKTYKEVFPLYFFGSGWAISEKIYELPEK